MTDLLARTAELVDIPSVSHDERAIADRIETELREVPWLTVERVGDNVVARTDLGRPMRLVLAGHTDTVPPNGNERATVEGDVLHGVGACDMKAGLAVFLELARTVAEPAVDVSYVFYVCEEVEGVHNGLGHLFRDRPDLVAGDAAVLGEPTEGLVEAGCQGSLRLDVVLTGARAHTARPWKGRNAIHRLGRLLAVVEGFDERRPVIDGCEYREALQAVRVSGGVAGNVVPDAATLTVNHRVAPDRTIREAEAAVRALLAPVLEEGDVVTLVDSAPPAAPGLDHPLLGALTGRNAMPVRAKLGWTDVARFAANGVPAVNLGPGDPTIAHTAEEHVDRASIERVHGALLDLLTTGP
jgi:succinyl-diaminopimelate desuccinylase